MKALTFKRYGKSAEIDLVDVMRPTINPDELLVQVHAAAVNPIDNMIPTGIFKPVLHYSQPMIMGSDLAGIVIAVGERVTRFKPGDAVFASLFDLGRGAIAEFAAVPEKAAAHKPEHLDFIAAASIPMVALTSWQALREVAKLKPGQKVFIPAGAGGIGTMAIQLAKVMGAWVGTSTSTGNIPLVRSLGADEVVDYTQQPFDQALQDYDVVLATIRGDALVRAIRILKPRGKLISLVGPLDAAFAHARHLHVFWRILFRLMSRKIRRLASNRQVDYSFVFVRADGAQLTELGELLATGQIHPVIDRVFPLNEAKDALDYLALGHAKGKVVITVC